MTKRLRLSFPSEEVTAIAALLEEEAPETCRILWNALPFQGELNHAIWSGPETYLPIDPGLRAPPEHQTTHPFPGDIGFYSLPGNRLVDWPDDFAELAFFYGRGARPSMPDGPVAMNLFASIFENLEGFTDVCHRIRREGIKVLRVEREER
jgi:hypothetical protein